MPVTVPPEPIEHRRLHCGAELAVMAMPERPVVAMMIRLLAGYAFEQPEHLGVTHVLEESLSKGTARRNGRELNDAFDAIGATHSSYAGRETVGLLCTCLPEFTTEALALHAEMIRTPSFPEDACRTAVELTRQALAALDDDPGELVRKLLHRHAYGRPLDRHLFGEKQTLDRIDRSAVVAHHQRLFAADRMHVAVAGAVDPSRLAEQIDRAFEGFTPPPDAARQIPREQAGTDGRWPLRFQSGLWHYDKQLEQQHVALCFPCSAVTDDDFPVEQVLVAVLSGGMSSRLFTEVREKLGLVYWVGAWADHPRAGGMLHLGASTTPQRADQTYATLLREVDRVGDDLTADELDRAITGLVTAIQTRGDVARSRATRMADDLFYHGRPIATAEKIARIRAVTTEDVARYLQRHRRDRLGVVTLGPRRLSGAGVGP